MRPFLAATVTFFVVLAGSLGAVRAGAETPSAIVEAAYTDVSPSLYWLAERSTLAHLEKLEAEGRVIKRGDSRYRAA